MTIVFKKIPKLAKLLYLVGFCIIASAMILFFYFPLLLEPFRVQQIFIGGAIVVIGGSVVNTIYQFKKRPHTEED